MNKYQIIKNRREEMVSVKCILSFLLIFLFITCSAPEKSVDIESVSPEERAAYERIEDLKKKVKDEPNNLEWRNQLANEYQMIGKNEEALKTFEDALKLDPSRSDLRYSYANFALNIGERKKAYQSYKEILQGLDADQYLNRIAPKFMDIYDVMPVIATEDEEAFGTYSSDGLKIIFQAYKYGNWDIFEYNKASQSTTQLTFNQAHEENPAYSPDNRFIAYTSTRDDHRNVSYEQKLRDIYIMDLSNKMETNITSNSSNDWRPRYSKDGKSIVFVSERSDLRNVDFVDLYSHIYLMESDGDFQMQLTNIEGNDGGAVLSGNEMDPIYFDSNRNGNYCIYKMNSDGSEQKQVTFNQSFDNVAPDLNPDDTKIVFFSDRDGNFEIYMMNIDGEDEQKLTSNPADDVNPIFSPDGKKVLFHTNRNGNYDIFEMDLESGKDQLPLYDVIALIDEAIAGLETPK